MSVPNRQLSADGPSRRRSTEGLEFTTGIDPGTIQQPDWFESVSKPTLSVESDDRLLAYEYTGDQSLEAGTTLAIGTGTSGFDVETKANVTLGQSVTPGETVYVYRTGDGEDATYTAAVGERPSVPDDAVAFSEVVTVTVRIGDTELEAGASTRDD